MDYYNTLPIFDHAQGLLYQVNALLMQLDLHWYISFIVYNFCVSRMLLLDIFTKTYNQLLSWLSTKTMCCDRIYDQFIYLSVIFLI